MDLGLTDKTALVLAASRGLGRATAREFAREGARVLVASRDEAKLRAAAEEIARETGREVIAQRCDVTRAEEIEALAARAREVFGRVDVLITNAGGPPAGNFADFDDAAWQRAFETNLLSSVRAIRAVLPLMRGGAGGRIVNLASVSVRQPIPGLILSNVFRAGVAALTKSLANELGSENILVNTIGPGRIATERIEELDQYEAKRTGKSAEDVRKGFQAMMPLGRYGTPEEFARALVWLGSWANTYVTGQVLLVDGGLVKSI